MAETLPGAGPFLFEGGERAALLIHGFTGCSDEMAYLGQKLAENGYTARLPLLPGHGTEPDDLRDVTRADWIAAVEREFDNLAAKHSEVFILGLSMGGLLALELAASARGRRAKALVLLATPLKLKVPILPSLLAPIASWKILNKISWNKGDEGAAIADPVEKEKAITYPGAPGRSVAQLFRLMKDVRPQKVTLPTMLVYSIKDPTVPFYNVRMLKQRLASPHIETLVLEKSHHVVSRDYEKDKVATAVTDFLNRF